MMSRFILHPCGCNQCAPCSMAGYEQTEIDFACQYLDRRCEAGTLNKRFIDVGAHVGLWSLKLSEWYQDRYEEIPTIYALEADAINYKQLKKNADQGQTGIMAVNLAVWNKNAYLFMQKNANFGRHRVTDKGVCDRTAVRVNGIALDSVAKTPEQRKMDIIKIDVEGAELMVLNGARQILIDNPELLVVVEYSLDHMAAYGYRPHQCTAFMQAHNFRPARPEDEVTINRIQVGELKRVMFVKGDTL